MATGTLHGMFIDAARRSPGSSAYRFREGGEWKTMTFGEAHERVRNLGSGFVKLGVAAGDRFAILSNTRVEWSLCDYAILGTGATVVPIYQTNSPAECEYILDNCNAMGVVVEDAAQLAKVAEVKGSLPNLRHVVVMDPTGTDGMDLGDASLISLAALEESGVDAGPSGWETAAKSVSPDTLATLIYTSGTTGPPKGCMLTHSNYVHMTHIVADTEDGYFHPDDRLALFLPLAHSFARLIHFASSHRNMELAFSTIATLMDDLADIRPTILPSVPRVFEKAYTRILGQFNEADGVKLKLINWARGVGALRGKYIQRGRRVPPVLALQHAIAHKLVFSKIHARFGGELRICISGGAPLSREVQEFFLSCGIIILEGYGLTESGTAATLNKPSNFRVGSVGQAIGDTELKLGEDDEILIRGGQVFKGYFGNEEATAEVLDKEGWLHSGDIGFIDKEGFIFITDRKKDIIVTAGGKNISPQNIENGLKATQYISQALVYGDRRPYLTALITLDPEEMATFAKDKGLPTEMTELIQRDEVQQLVADAVAHVNSDVGQVAHVKRWRILPVDFSQETGELTPTLKLKRKVVVERYGKYIEEIYQPDAPETGAITDAAVADLQRQPIEA
jgi:long-chain acyl-CoA synthetase